MSRIDTKDEIIDAICLLQEQVKQLQIEIIRIKNTRSDMVDVISL